MYRPESRLKPLLHYVGHAYGPTVFSSTASKINQSEAGVIYWEPGYEEAFWVEVSEAIVSVIVLEPYGPATDLIPGVDDHPNARGHRALGIGLANYWNATNGLQ